MPSPWRSSLATALRSGSTTLIGAGAGGSGRAGSSTAEAAASASGPSCSVKGWSVSASGSRSATSGMRGNAGSVSASGEPSSGTGVGSAGRSLSARGARDRAASLGCRVCSAMIRPDDATRRTAPGRARSSETHPHAWDRRGNGPPPKSETIRRPAFCRATIDGGAGEENPNRPPPAKIVNALATTSQGSRPGRRAGASPLGFEVADARPVRGGLLVAGAWSQRLGGRPRPLASTPGFP